MKHESFSWLITYSKEKNVQELLQNDLFNFGCIVEIEKAREKFPIILVYAGENHTKFIKNYYLKNNRYETLFKIKNNDDKLPEKEKMLEFFKIIQDESDRVSKQNMLKKKKNKNNCMVC